MDADSPNSWFPELNLDPALAEAVETAPAEQIIEGILRLEDRDDVPPLFSVVSRFNRICTGRFQAEHARTIRQHPNVISFKATRSLGISYNGEDLTAPGLPGEAGMPPGPTAPFGGRDCIVAALDFGLDFAHPNFLTPDGTTRLVSFWHQGATYDPAHPNRYGYGRVFSREEINAALSASDPYRALGYHPSISDTGNGSHGTHTLDIAAGNGRAGGARAAPAANADLMFVHLSTPRLGVVGDLGDSVRMLEALDHVERTAGGRPWVVNLSVGRTAGSHDGTSLVEQGMHELLRLGPGRAIVQSAGNYRSANLAVEGWCRDGEFRDLEWIVDPTDTTDNEIDAWYSGKDRFVIGIRPPHGQVFVEVKLGDVADIVHEGAVVGRLYHRRNDPNNRDNHAEVFLYPGAPPGVWTLRLIGEYVIGGRFHAWIERDLARPGAQSRFDSGITTQSYTLGTIATSPLVITVGAYDANAERSPLAPFSSCGPTRDERWDKPELLAPGVGVVAARSIPRGAPRQEGLLVARSGTSMAAPHVTGAVAAMFEAAGRPVSIDEIRDCLRRSAEPVTDAESAGCRGWGRLNVAGAIREIRGSKAADLAPQPLMDIFAPDTPAMIFDSTLDASVESFAGEPEIEASSEDGGFINLGGISRVLEQAEQAVHNIGVGRRQSERSFLQKLLRKLDDRFSIAVPSPAELFRAVLRDGPLMQEARDLLEILALPSQRLRDDLRPGDWLLRAVPGTGDVGHISVLASDELMTPATLSSEGIASESVQPGYYGLVIEAGAFPHGRARPFARRVLDGRGRVPPNTVVLRPRYSDSGVVTDYPPYEPYSDRDVGLDFEWQTDAQASQDESTTQGLSVLVVDERGQPLVEGEYAIYQDGRSERGAFAKGGNGLALFKTIDTAQAFIFEVRDRVCAISAGAFIDPDNPAIEYGGTWFDWTLVRDNKNPETAFWPHYLAEMKADANRKSVDRKSVDRFWQHEHIVRRPIRAIGSAGGASNPVRICAVPTQIRTGPIVRYTNHRCACIWVEPVTPSLVRVRAKRAGGREKEKIAYASTVRVGGRHFAVIEVDGLDEDTFYQYTLELAPLPANGAIPVGPTDVDGKFPEITTDVRHAIRRQLAEASVEKIEWLSFRTLRSRYDKSLRFATGSCRWYPGDVIGGDKNKLGKYWGPDMLDKLGEWLIKTPRTQWPHFQFYGGDQIYSDEIGDKHHVELIRARFASRVPGPTDPNASVADRLIDGAWAGRFAHRLVPLKLPPPAVRNNVEAGLKMIDSIYAQSPVLKLFANRRATEKQIHDQYQTRLTRRRDVQGASREADDEREARIAVNLLPRLKQLLVTAEPFRVYRPYWDAVPGSRAFNRQAYNYRSCNFLLWKLPNREADLPTLQDQSAGDVGVRGEAGRSHASADNGRHVADFAEYAFLHECAWTTSSNVRVLLGNLPTFLMFDDHEMTDDWNFDIAWVRMIHSTRDHYRMWPKTLTDGLCAYWMYQGLCNKAPSQWRDDPRAKILDQARRAGVDALPELRKCIYRAVLQASPPNAEATFQTGCSLEWHYRLPFEPPFLVPDCRTRKRLVPADDQMRVIDHKRNPPQSETIDSDQIKWMRDVLDGCKHPVAFIAPSTPLMLQEKLMVFMTKPETAARAWAGEVDASSGLAVFLGSTALAIASNKLIRLFRREKDLEHMVRDKSWRDLWGLAERLRLNRSPVKTLVLVSGDVHHSYCMTGNLAGGGRPFPELLQITSSGLRTTIRGGTKERVAAGQSSLSFDMAGRHMVPGFMSKPGSRRRELVLYKNAVSLVDVSMGKDVDVRVVYLAGEEPSEEIEQYVYQYTSGPSYLKMGEPSNTPYRMGEGALEAIEAAPVEGGSSLEPGQSIIVDGQQVRTYADAVAWYAARRDVLLEQRRGIAGERYQVPAGLDDLTRTADDRIQAARTLGRQPLSDRDVEAMLEWFDRYIEVLRACDSKIETIVIDRFRATRAQNEKFKEEVERMRPRLRDLQRSAFRAENRNKLKETAEVFATTLDSVLVAEQWVREAATHMKDFVVLGTTLRTQKALHGSRKPWHELMRQSTNARVAKLLSIGKGLNNVLAAWQLVDAGITMLAGGKTTSAQASAGISFAATLASAGGTLLGASGFFSLYNNLYLGPMVKRILGQIEQLKDLESTGNNHPLIQLGDLDAVNWKIEPGGREMYEFMFGVMKARTVRDVKMIPDGVRKYFSKHRKDFDAGTPKRHGEKLNYEEFEDKRVWVYILRDDIWGMLYGSMPVPASLRKQP